MVLSLDGGLPFARQAKQQTRVMQIVIQLLDAVSSYSFRLERLAGDHGVN